MHDLPEFQLGDSYRTLAKAVLAHSKQQLMVKTYQRGDVLLQQGHQQQYGYLVQDGVLAAFYSSDSGALPNQSNQISNAHRYSFN